MTEPEGVMHKYFRAARAFKALLSRHIMTEGRLCVASIYGIYSVMAGYILRQVLWCWRLSVHLLQSRSLDDKLTRNEHNFLL